MKKMIALLVGITMLACSSMSPKSEELKQSSQCTVWKEGPLGTKSITVVDGEVAQQKQTCWIMNMFGCTYTDYTYKGTSNEILSSLPPADKAIAHLDGNKLSVNMAGVTIEPFELKSGKADYTLQAPIGPKQSMTVEYNNACSNRQAALGILTVIAK
jgi:hypothetical protein